MTADKSTPLQSDEIFGLFKKPVNYYVPKSEKKDSFSLLENCRNSFPLNCVIGPSGSGLTALSFWIYESLPVETHEVLYLTKTPGDSSTQNWLLKRILMFFGRDLKGDESTTQLFKEVLDEVEQIREEQRRLLVIIDDPDNIDANFWRLEIEPLLAINSVQQYSFSFLINLSESSLNKVETLPTFQQAFSMKKGYLEDDEVRPYLETRLIGSLFETYSLSDKDLSEIKLKSNGHFGRINELSSVILSRIRKAIEMEKAEDEKKRESDLEVESKKLDQQESQEVEVKPPPAIPLPKVEMEFSKEDEIKIEVEKIQIPEPPKLKDHGVVASSLSDDLGAHKPEFMDEEGEALNEPDATAVADLSNASSEDSSSEQSEAISFAEVDKGEEERAHAENIEFEQTSIAADVVEETLPKKKTSSHSNEKENIEKVDDEEPGDDWDVLKSLLKSS